jgi:hypothetical protein
MVLHTRVKIAALRNTNGYLNPCADHPRIRWARATFLRWFRDAVLVSRTGCELCALCTTRPDEASVSAPWGIHEAYHVWNDRRNDRRTGNRCRRTELRTFRLAVTLALRYEPVSRIHNLIVWATSRNLHIGLLNRQFKASDEVLRYVADEDG